MLILQIITQQWDKSQKTTADALERANIPDRYPIMFPTAFYDCNKRCVIDKHGDDRLGGRLKYSLLAGGKLHFDRFQLSLKDQALVYSGAPKSGTSPLFIGSTDNRWLQCTYTDRYSVFEGGFYYWLYEQVTFNAVSVAEFNENVFMTGQPALVFNDVNVERSTTTPG